MSGRIYSALGCGASLLWPVAIFFVIALREHFGGAAPLNDFLSEHPVYDTVGAGLFAAGLLLPPILLIVGLFKAKDESARAWPPFAFSLAAYSIGSTALLVYIKSFALKPLLALLIYLVIYGAALFLRQRKKRNPPPEPIGLARGSS